MATVIKTVAEYQADVSGGAPVYDPSDVVTIQDTSANLSTLSTAEITALQTYNVDAITASDGPLRWDGAQWQAMSGVFLNGYVIDFSGSDTVLYDTGANLALLSGSDLEYIGYSGARTIDASDDALTLTTSQLQALQAGGIGLTDADVITVSDKLYTSETYYQMGVDNILGPTVSKTVAEYQADVASVGVPYAAGDGVVLHDTAANLSSLSTSEIGDLSLNNVDYIHSDDGVVQWSAAQWQALGSPFDFDGAGLVLFDSGANLQALDPLDFFSIGSLGVTTIDVSDDAVTFDADTLSGIVSGGLTLTADDVVTLSDTTANVTNFGSLASLAAAGVDLIDLTDNGPFQLNAADALSLAIGQVAFAADDVVVLSDDAANLTNLDGFVLSELAAAGVDSLDSTDDLVLLNVDQYKGLGTIQLTDADQVEIVDFGAELATLDFSTLAANHVDLIDATDNLLAISYDQFTDLGGFAIAGNDQLVILDTGANIAALSTGVFGELSAGGVDRLDASDDVLSLSIAQLNALGSMHLTASDTVTMADSEANIEALSGLAFWSIYGAAGVDIVDADENVLNLSADQVGGVATAVNLKFATDDLVTLVDSSTNVMSAFGSNLGKLATLHVDAINLSDDAITLTVAQSQALGAVTFAAGDTGVVVADTEAHLEALSASALTAMKDQGVDRLDATDGTVSFTAAQYAAMGAMVFTSTDAVTVSGTSAALLALDLSALATHNVDRIDSTDGALTLTVAQLTSLGSVALTAGDTVTLADTGANLAALSAATLGGLEASNVDALDATDDAVSFDLAQLSALGAVTLTGTDVVSLLDTGAAIEGLGAGALGELSAQGVDILDATDDLLQMDASQVAQVITDDGLTFAAADNVVLVDSGANVKASLNGAFGELGSENVDSIDLTDDAISVTASELLALDGVTFAASDTGVVGEDLQANLEALNATQIAALATTGVDRLDASDTDALSFTVAQYNAMGAMVFTAGDDVTLTGSGADLAALDFSAFSTDQVDHLDASDDVLNLTAAQLNALGSTQLTAGDTVTLADTQAHIEALTGSDLSGYGEAGVDIIDSASDVLNLSAAQVAAVASEGSLTFAGADTVTLSDTSAAVLSAFGADFSVLADIEVDVIDLSDNAISIDFAQVLDLDTVRFAADDTNVVLLDTGNHLGELGGQSLQSAVDVGVDRLDASDDAASFSLDQLDQFADAGVTLTAGDEITAVDLGASLAGLSVTEINALAAQGVDAIDVEDNAISLAADKYAAFAANFTFAADDVVRVSFTSGADVAAGGDERDIFLGKNGDDTLDGGGGADKLTGGNGKDILTGGAGNDVFIFSSLGQTGLGVAADRITDLANGDRIDLAGIDADVNTAGDQAFTLVTAFTHHAGEVLVKYNAKADVTVFKMDVDGDGHADAMIKANGDHTDFTHFVL